TLFRGASASPRRPASARSRRGEPAFLGTQGRLPPAHMPAARKPRRFFGRPVVSGNRPRYSGPMSTRYGAPFAPGAAQAIDHEIARKLLEIALSRGGNYADLFFEYCAAGGYSYDEGILKSASRAVTMGLGVRVMKGDATGYAYVED